MAPRGAAITTGREKLEKEKVRSISQETVGKSLALALNKSRPSHSVLRTSHKFPI